MKPTTITGQIDEKALDLLAKHPKGIGWTDLNRMIQEAYPEFHPKTINGCVWKLAEKYPDQVEKSPGGPFKIRKIN